jgi:vesicle coat complex subunit
MSSEKCEMNNIPRKDALRLCHETQDIKTILALTAHDDPIVRQRALKEICPCRVKDDIDLFWERVLEMITDPADNVREQVSISLSFI